MARRTTDTALAFRTLALTKTAITDVVGTRIYAASDLPDGYQLTPDPARPTLSGPAILVVERPGVRDSGSGVVVSSGLYVRCYAATETDARELDAILAEALDGAQTTELRSLTQALSGVRGRDPQGGWPFAASTWNVVAF